MKIFDMDTGPGSHRFRITDEDKHWVEENFRWLKSVFGYPDKRQEQVLLSPQFFPASLASGGFSIDNVVTDLCNLFCLPGDIVKVNVVTDLRDYNSVPYEIAGAPFEAETELRRGDHRIFVANSLQKHPERLIHSLICEFIRIRLAESEIEFDVGGDDTDLFIYLAGIYYGFGVILAQNLLHEGRDGDGTWDIRWSYGSEMPAPVMAFSLATYANLTGENNPEWKNEFKGDFRRMLEEAFAYVQSHPSDLYDENEVKAGDLFDLANAHFDKNDLEEAISTLQKILFITNDDHMKADVFNNMGYYYLRKRKFQEAISSFRKALISGPEYGYANDNLGYALIMTGDLEEGYSFLEKAMRTGNNDIAYTYRNLALYHQRRNEPALAEEFFRKSFQENTPVDLLEYHYGEFLLEQGDAANAKAYFIKSAARQEQEGIERLGGEDVTKS